ncbi:MAG TPA: hypothetical protein VG758_12840 [Hyphomicrobiaceae bacterium]|jgi:hypothetical protein|nr:hypothetical protein [Hyphomicrobiaceae bacterium]
MTRRAAAVGTLSALVPALIAPVALAHGGERAFVLLMPTGYYLAGGTLAVAATFLLLAFLPGRISDRLAGARLPLLTLRPPSPVAISLLSFLFLGVLLATGLFGSRDPLANPLPLTVWTLWWVGFTLATAALGNLWAYVNPWTGPYRLIMRLQAMLTSKVSKVGAIAPPPPLWGRDRVGGIAELQTSAFPPPLTPPHKGEGNPVGASGGVLLPYPRRLGYWPAIVLFLGFAWFELIDIAPDDPERLAVAVGAYWLFTFIAVVLFGEDAWLGRAEPFSVFFRFIGGLSPLLWSPADDNETRQRLSLALPGAALLDRGPLPPSGALFILLTLASVSFDGLAKTFWWLGLNGINPLEFPGRSGVLGINSAGLVLTWEVLAVLYTAAVLLGWWLAGRQGKPGALLGTLVFSIMPIAIGFHFSHYLTALLVNAQYAYAAASDPFGAGTDVLALGHFHVTTSFLNTYEGTRAIWNAQTSAIVAGHVLAVLLAHELARRTIADQRALVLSQLPLAAIMVAYTLFGLWLLSTPVAG